MLVHTLRVGDELLLGGEVRVTVLEVRGDTVLLGLVLPGSAPEVRVEVPHGQPLPAGLAFPPSNN
jgi:sRNA-binding carbon storage regulator CsrA